MPRTNYAGDEYVGGPNDEAKARTDCSGVTWCGCGCRAKATRRLD